MKERSGNVNEELLPRGVIYFNGLPSLTHTTHLFFVFDVAIFMLAKTPELMS